MILIIQPAERVLFSDTRAPTRSRASNAQDWFESFTLIGSSESSRENSGKIFDLFSPPGPSWSPNSAPMACEDFLEKYPRPPNDEPVIGAVASKPGTEEIGLFRALTFIASDHIA